MNTRIQAVHQLVTMGLIGAKRLNAPGIRDENCYRGISGLRETNCEVMLFEDLTPPILANFPKRI